MRSTRELQTVNKRTDRFQYFLNKKYSRLENLLPEMAR
jgi:hypothetical protein